MKRPDIERILALMPRTHWTGERELRQSLESISPTLDKCLAKAAFAVGRDAGRAEVHQRIDEAHKRIAELEKYVGEHLEWMGACENSDDDGEETLCAAPSCTYCQMARVLQPNYYGGPLEGARC